MAPGVQKIYAWGMLFVILVMSFLNRFFPPGDWKLLIWLMLCLPTFFHVVNYYPVKLRIRKYLFIWVLIGAVGYAVLYLATGVLDGFGRSPYNRTFGGILYNIAVGGGFLFLFEWMRAFIVRGLNTKKRYVALVIAIVFFLYELDMITLLVQVNQPETMIPYLSAKIFPALVLSMLLTYLAYLGGIKFSAVYRILPQLVFWAMPILPNIKWMMEMMVSIAFPIFVAVLLDQLTRLYRREDHVVKRKGSMHPAVWIVIAGAVVAMFAFVLGFLPVRPMVIATNSMYPSVQAGDVVLMVKTDAETLVTGDVIAYRMEGVIIMHRIVAVERTPEIQFTLKGDNNEQNDLYPVTAEQLEGKIIGVIPYLGRPALWMRSLSS